MRWLGIGVKVWVIEGEVQKLSKLVKKSPQIFLESNLNRRLMTWDFDAKI